MPDIYKPAASPSTYGSTKPLDESRCKAGVWSKDRWARYSQCARKAGEEGWCKQHHPDAEKLRNEAAKEAYEKSVRRDAMGWYGERFLAALVKIRDGDNDPRETARLALERCKYAAPDILAEIDRLKAEAGA